MQVPPSAANCMRHQCLLIGGKGIAAGMWHSILNTMRAPPTTASMHSSMAQHKAGKNSALAGGIRCSIG